MVWLASVVGVALLAPGVDALSSNRSDRPVGALEMALAAADAHIALFQGNADERVTDAMERQRATLAVARESLDQDERTIADRFDVAIALGKHTSPRESSGGRRAPHRPRYGMPSDAATVLAHRHRIDVTGERLRDVQRLDSLPRRVRDSLTELLAEFIDLEDTANDVFGPLALRVDPAAPLDAATASLLPSATLERVLRTRDDVLDAIVGFNAAATEAPLMAGASVDLCPAFAVDISGQSSTYTERCALIVDTAGNDYYPNNAGGGGVCGGDGSAIAAGTLVDLGGNDRFGHPELGCGINGGGSLGAGLLVDGGGNDIYDANYGGVNGGGNIGAGLLIDVDGDDHYNARDIGTNGGAALGSGMLIDLRGDDQYRAGFNATNGGAYWSASGRLIDGGGDDIYTADKMGANGGAYGQGAAGLLLDVSGTDSYSATGPNVNGGGSNVGSGLLIDAHGAFDSYADLEGGTGTDRTVVPKGESGAQLDLAPPVTPPTVPPNLIPPVPTIRPEELPTVGPVPTISPTPTVPIPATGRHVSDDCDAGTNVVSGFLGDAYLKLRHSPSAIDPTSTFVCVALETGGSHLGGRLTIGGGSPSGDVPVDQDSASAASCAATAGNVRVQGGTVAGGEPYWIDAAPAPAASGETTWVCVRLTSAFGVRLRVPGPAVLGTTGFVPDGGTTHAPAYSAGPWPTPGLSASCAAAVSGTRTRLIDATVGTSRVGLYAWQESPSRAHVCIRGGGVGGAGGRLTVDTAASPGVSPVVTTTNSTAPCPFDVVTRTDAPSYGVYVSDPSALPNPPVSGCVGVADFAAGATIGADAAATARWSPDPV